MQPHHPAPLGALTLCAVLGACGSEPDESFNGADVGGSPSNGGQIPTLGATDTADGAASGASDDEQPATCAEAARVQSYVGCDFWPTVVTNPVWSVFDFAVVVANAGTAAADVKVQRGSVNIATATIAPGAVEAIYLPWVTELKGPDFGSCTTGARPTSSALVRGGAYHLVSTVPVTVWQFSPLEYKAGEGGPPGKNWTCPYPPASCNGNGIDCLSVSNDASLLLPVSAMTGSYRLFGATATTYGSASPPDQDMDSPGAFAITATEPGTQIVVSLANGASIAGGAGVTATSGGSLTLALDAGDVAMLLGARGATYGAPDSDLSGSLVTSNHRVQVIALSAITDVPSPLVSGGGWADHLEETVLPAESLGAHYVVVPPTAPAGGTTHGHYLRFFGNRDGTTLSYTSGTAPPGAPHTLSAGQVVDVPGLVSDSFEVVGSSEFAIASIMPGSELQDPGSSDPQGDPSLTFVVAVEQFRHRDVFLAPADYAKSYVDILSPASANVLLDGKPVGAPSGAVGGWTVYRAPLAGIGAHTISSDVPVGTQIMGFGHATSYLTLGGLNVKRIAQPPPPLPR